MISLRLAQREAESALALSALVCHLPGWRQRSCPHGAGSSGRRESPPVRQHRLERGVASSVTQGRGSLVWGRARDATEGNRGGLLMAVIPACQIGMMGWPPPSPSPTPPRFSISHHDFSGRDICHGHACDSSPCPLDPLSDYFLPCLLEPLQFLCLPAWQH